MTIFFKKNSARRCWTSTISISDSLCVSPHQLLKMVEHLNCGGTKHRVEPLIEIVSSLDNNLASRLEIKGSNNN
jgi:spore cortex formation protein SpoVR/YcgB (stage V sporulation)